MKHDWLICFLAQDFLSLYFFTHNFHKGSCNPSFIIGLLTGVLRWRTDNSLLLSRPGSHNERSRCPGENSARREGNYSIQAEGFYFYFSALCEGDCEKTLMSRLTTSAICCFVSLVFSWIHQYSSAFAYTLMLQQAINQMWMSVSLKDTLLLHISGCSLSLQFHSLSLFICHHVTWAITSQTNHTLQRNHGIFGF